MMKENYSWWRPENNKHFQFWIMGWLNMNHPKVAETIEINKYKKSFFFICWIIIKMGRKALLSKKLGNKTCNLQGMHHQDGRH